MSYGFDYLSCVMPLPQARDVQHGRACGSTDDQNSLEGRSSMEGRMDMSAAETNSMLRKEISLLTLRLKSYETESCRFAPPCRACNEPLHMLPPGRKKP